MLDSFQRLCSNYDFFYISSYVTNHLNLQLLYLVSCREGAFHVVLGHFSEESSHIITELHSHPRSLFLYLKTLIEFHLFGTLDLSNLSKDDTMNPLNGRQVKDHSEGVRDYLENISKFPKFMREKPIHVPDDLIELYLEVSFYTNAFAWLD